jgi:hypothetical protein
MASAFAVGELVTAVRVALQWLFEELTEAL